MAITQTGGSYSGKDAGSLIGREIVKGDSLSSGIFTIRQYTKGKGVMRKFSFGAGDLQSGATCGWNAAGGAIVNKEITLVPLKANVEACKNEFNFDFTAYDMEDGTAGMLSAEAVDVISTEILRAVALQIDQDIWQAIKTEGLLDGDVVDVVLVAPTKATIIEEVDKMYSALAAIPGFSAEKAFIVMSPYNKALLEQAYAGLGTNTAFYLGEKATNFIGVKIVASPGVVNTEMYASNSDNMYFFTDLSSDYNSVTVKDMDETDLSGNIRFKALWTQGASFAQGSELVMGATA